MYKVERKETDATKNVQEFETLEAAKEFFNYSLQEACKDGTTGAVITLYSPHGETLYQDEVI